MRDQGYHFYLGGRLYIKNSKLPSNGTVNVYEFESTQEDGVRLIEIDCFTSYWILSYDNFQRACIEHNDYKENEE